MPDKAFTIRLNVVNLATPLGQISAVSKKTVSAKGLHQHLSAEKQSTDRFGGRCLEEKSEQKHLGANLGEGVKL